jgi:hypothetical protein
VIASKFYMKCPIISSIIPDLAGSIRECLSDTLDRISDSYKIASGGNTAAGNNRAFHVEFTCNHVTSLNIKM